MDPSSTGPVPAPPAPRAAAPTAAPRGRSLGCRLENREGAAWSKRFKWKPPARRRTNASATAYRAILFRLIVTLQLRPGAILNENSLMQRLQCGRTPLREALLDLERQSLVRIVPRQATLVSEITLADAAEIYEALECIEGPVARLAAARMGPALPGRAERHRRRAARRVRSAPAAPRRAVRAPASSTSASTRPSPARRVTASCCRPCSPCAAPPCG